MNNEKYIILYYNYINIYKHEIFILYLIKIIKNYSNNKSNIL